MNRQCVWYRPLTLLGAKMKRLTGVFFTNCCALSWRKERVSLSRHNDTWPLRYTTSENILLRISAVAAKTLARCASFLRASGCFAGQLSREIPRGVFAEDTASVKRLLARATPSDCWVFSVGSVAFVLAPRGPGNGYKTHKRLGAELKGAHIIRCGAWVATVLMLSSRRCRCRDVTSILERLQGSIDRKPLWLFLFLFLFLK